MKHLSAIGLDTKKSKQIAEKLNELLANYSILNQNVKGYHWNIEGEKFFELHIKFEELYNDLVLKIDEIAERILTLGHSPKHQFTEYQKLSAVTESKNISDGHKAIRDILESFKTIISIQREIFLLSVDTGDEGTEVIMSDYIRSQEKLVWMFSAFLHK